MSIAFFGSSLVSAYWNGAATYYRGILSALAGRGHRITFFEPDAYGRQQHRDIADPPWARVVVYPAEEPAARRALAEAADADLVVKASGVGVFDRLLESGVLALQGPSTLVAFWDVDAPATLDRLAADPGDHLAALIPRYDIVFTYGGGVPVTTAYERLGARCCVPIYNALDPMTHHPVEGDRRFEGALGFLGNRLPDRERRVDELFFAAAARLPSERFLLGGSGWDDRELPANVVRLGHVFTRDHNAFNVSPRAVLNISRDSMAAYGFSPATRVFEAAGAGACLITDAWAGIEEFLEPGREVLVARSGDDVARHVRRISRGEARGIGARARQRVLREHTYDHRALDVEAALGETWRRRRVELPGSRPPPPQRRLDIVILGLSITSSWGNGHATTYRSLVRELDARGHRVLFLERDVPWYAAHRDMPCPAFGRTELYADFDDLVRRFGAAVAAADLVMVGSYVPGGVDIGNWVTRTAGGATAFYDIDTPVTLAALEDGGCDYLSPELVSRYDLYLSFTGGPTLERIERQYGAPRALPLYCSVDPIQYHPEERGPAGRCRTWAPTARIARLRSRSCCWRRRAGCTISASSSPAPGTRTRCAGRTTSNGSSTCLPGPAGASITPAPSPSTSRVATWSSRASRRACASSRPPPARPRSSATSGRASTPSLPPAPRSSSPDRAPRSSPISSRRRTRSAAPSASGRAPGCSASIAPRAGPPSSRATSLTSGWRRRRGPALDDRRGRCRARERPSDRPSPRSMVCSVVRGLPAWIRLSRRN
jgi:spore maturation protein CgeB